MSPLCWKEGREMTQTLNGNILSFDKQGSQKVNKGLCSQADSVARYRMGEGRLNLAASQDPCLGKAKVIRQHRRMKGSKEGM